MTTAEALEAHCRDFIAKQRISCRETIYQTDHVIENAYTFIEGVCNIVGYQPDEDDEDDDQSTPEE
jgi:hypothetical protein